MLSITMCKDHLTNCCYYLQYLPRKPRPRDRVMGPSHRHETFVTIQYTIKPLHLHIVAITYNNSKSDNNTLPIRTLNK